MSADAPARDDPPSAAAAMPPEVERVLARPEPVVVLVRGPSGTGKSAIASRIAERWPGPTVWASTRIAPGAFLREHPPKADTRVLDLSLTGAVREGAREQYFVARDALLHWFESGAPAEVHESLPKALADALPHEPDGSGRLLVVDSWDGLVDRYLDLSDSAGSPALRPGRVERLLYALLRGLDLSLVLVSEAGDSEGSDNLADVVFVTGVAEFEERLVRILSLPKVRGQPVGEAVYPYTLAGGRFSYIPRLEPGTDLLDSIAEPDPAPTTKGRLWSGSSGFDQAFGRLVAGEVSVYESDPNVPQDALRLITSSAALSTMVAGGNLLLVIPPDVDLSRMLSGFDAIVRPGEAIESRLRVLTAGAVGGLPSEFKRIFVTPQEVGSADFGFIAVREDRALRTQPMFPETTRFLRTAGPEGAPNLAIVSLDGLAAAAASFGREYQPEVLPALFKQDVMGASAHMMVLARSNDPLLPPLRAIGNPYVRVLERQGRVFLFGVRPWTPAHVLLPPTSSKDPWPYELIRMS